MDANQDDLANPFGMDEDCEHCEALCETRSQVVHGYGDVGADFLLVGEAPDVGADAAGVPFVGDDAGERVLSILRRLGLCASEVDSTEPELVNVFLTNLTRCRHPERPPTDEEVANCEPFLNAEIRMINPEILVPVGQRALSTLAVDYTTTDPADLDVESDHAQRLRGRGFELVPMVDPATMSGERADEFVHAFSELMASDYRQTKGRRSR